MDCRHRTSIVTNSDRIMSSMLFASQARACLPGPASTPQQGLLPACARPEPGPNPARTRAPPARPTSAANPWCSRLCGQRRERRARADRTRRRRQAALSAASAAQGDWRAGGHHQAATGVRRRCRRRRRATGGPATTTAGTAPWASCCGSRGSGPAHDQPAAHRTQSVIL
jgi:hypothetical protein